jgi:hypothetical protein
MNCIFFWRHLRAATRFFSRLMRVLVASSMSAVTARLLPPSLSHPVLAVLVRPRLLGDWVLS